MLMKNYNAFDFTHKQIFKTLMHLHIPKATTGGGYSRSLGHHILSDSKFVVLLKTVLTFNYKTNDAIVSKIDHTF